MHLSDEIANRIAAHLQKIYRENFSEGVVNAVYKIMAEAPSVKFEKDSLWSQDDILLITYGDTIVSSRKISVVGAAEISRGIHRECGHRKFIYSRFFLILRMTDFRSRIFTGSILIWATA